MTIIFAEEIAAQSHCTDCYPVQVIPCFVVVVVFVIVCDVAASTCCTYICLIDHYLLGLSLWLIYLMYFAID